MTNLKIVGLSLLLATNISNASVIAVVDSGNDFKHPDLMTKAWVNPLEIADNDRDEDKNGYPDDVNGWNFAESNNKLIDYSYSSSYTEDSKRFFEIQLKSFLGTLTQDDRDWYKAKIKDENFIKNLQIFGNWMHGTHVTGITVKNSPDAKVVGIKLIPTEVKIPGKKGIFISTKNQRSEQFLFDDADKKEGGLKDQLLMAALGALAKQQSAVFTEIGDYIKGTGADVMNGSFGTPYSSIEGIIGTIFEKFYKRTATKEELKKFTTYFFTIQLEETKKFLLASPNTLFVFAAGNEGTNNDEYPTSPANVQGDNKITVAAALSDQSLAVFSNFGISNVEVAAPGVGIMSTIPMGNYLAVSGTSQASPFVANIAAKVKDVNPKLSVKEIKEIILGTVDVKEWLKGKVKTSGLVNRDRAVRAAELSRTMDLNQSISISKTDILAKTENEVLSSEVRYQIPTDLILPLPNPIKLSF
jgi:subtilisin family serine protease